MARPWTKPEDTILRRSFAWGTDKVLAREMTAGGFPRTHRAILARRVELGLYRHESRRPAP